MANNSHIRIIEESPIRNGLDTFRVSFKSIYEGRSLSYTSDALNHLTYSKFHTRPIVCFAEPFYHSALTIENKSWNPPE
ncbi:hypothetical protein N7530_008680 [Penicillium desertorum]|uniref:Uncharacterized protein n=1 Tax=Penicillium desertorum TaxID=1303715 RepID=A0A9X0BLE7_9EURO|nr:hypothetical protein N7530_008680 [Penicillium desertorum]